MPAITAANRFKRLQAEIEGSLFGHSNVDDQGNTLPGSWYVQWRGSIPYDAREQNDIATPIFGATIQAARNEHNFGGTTPRVSAGMKNNILSAANIKLRQGKG